MTVFEFRRTSATWLFTVVASSVLLFGTVDAAAVALVVVAIFGLAGVWAWYAMKGRISFVWDRLYLALALVPAVALIQVLIGTPHIYATMGEMVKWLAYLTFFVLCVNVFADAWIRRRFGRWLAVFGFLISGLALLQHYSSPEMAYWFREAPGGLIFGPFADRNHFAILIELLFPRGVDAGDQRPRPEVSLLRALCPDVRVGDRERLANRFYSSVGRVPGDHGIPAFAGRRNAT